MSWRDKLQDASFRGIPFKVSNSDFGTGRRNIIHQYPNRNVPFIEDLGQDTDEFTITGYVIQNIDNGFDYFVERDNLISALKQEGYGTLIHPFLGNVEVALIEKARIQESFDRGGMATFTMTFVRTDVDSYVSSVTDPIETVDTTAEDSVNKTLDNFVDNTVIPGRGFSKATLIADVTEFIAMNKKGILAVKGSLSSTVATALGVLSTNITNINDILATPSTTATMLNTTTNAFLYLIGEVGPPVTGGIVGTWSGEYRGETTELPGDTLSPTLGKSTADALVELNRFGEDTGTTDPSTYGGNLDPITITTTDTARESLNRLYVVNAGRNLALIMACRMAVRIDYDSYNDAIDTMNNIVDAMDDHLTKLGDEAASDTYRDYNLLDDNNDMYVAIEQLRSDFISSMKEIGASLAVIVDYECPYDGITTLELAYDRYMDMDRAEDIFQRNKTTVQHPGFLHGGQIIEILSE
jgi:prophage DNA circulation protein